MSARQSTIKQDARFTKSRNALLKASTQLLCRNPGASLSDMASFAGVGRATLYRHFSTREELIRELAREALRLTDEVLEPLRADTSLTGRRAIEESVAVMMPLADHFHFLCSLWNIAGDDEEVMAVYNRQLSELSSLVYQAQQQGDIDAGLPVAWVVASLDALMASAWWMIGEGMLDTEAGVRLIIRGLFDGVAPKERSDA